MKFGTLPSFGEITEIILHEDSNYQEINDTKPLGLRLSERILERLQRIITSLIAPRSWSSTFESLRASRLMPWWLWNVARSWAFAFARSTVLPRTRLQSHLCMLKSQANPKILMIWWLANDCS